MLQILKPARLEPVLRNKRSHCNEKPMHRNKDPTQSKINKSLKKNKKTFKCIKIKVFATASLDLDSTSVSDLIP